MQGLSLEGAQRQPLGRAAPSMRVSVRPHRSVALTQDVGQETRTGPVLLQRNSRGGLDGAVRVE